MKRIIAFILHKQEKVQRIFKKSQSNSIKFNKNEIMEAIDKNAENLQILSNVISIPVISSNHPGFDFEGGLIHGETLEPIQEALLIRYNKIVQIVPEIENKLSEDFIRLPFKTGYFFYGGLLFDNFGHFLLESLSRLWAWRNIQSKQIGILFYAPWGIPNYNKKNHYIYQVFQSLGIPMEQISFLNEPTRIENIIIPKQKYGFGICRNPDEIFMSFIKSFQIPLKNLSTTTKLKYLYISRSQMPFNNGRPFGEQLFENYLKTQGYDTVYPEKLTLYEQLFLYKNAERIIFCDGGATYCNILLPELKAEVVIIARRRDPRWNYKEITDHFLGYKKIIFWIDEVICQYQFGMETWDAAGEINWFKVSEQLVNIHFVNDFFDVNQTTYADTKNRELLEYIIAIHTNPLFIKYMEKLKEDHPLLPSSI